MSILSKTILLLFLIFSAQGFINESVSEDEELTDDQVCSMVHKDFDKYADFVF